jgi:hypothetical protein
MLPHVQASCSQTCCRLFKHVAARTCCRLFDHVAARHEVAVLRWRGARVQQLGVQGADDGLDGPYSADQGQGGELYSLLRGQGGSSGGQHGVPGDDLEGSEGAPIGRAGGHGHREGQPEVAAAANSKAARERSHTDEDGVRTLLHREVVDKASGQALEREEALPGFAAAFNGGMIRGVH